MSGIMKKQDTTVKLDGESHSYFELNEENQRRFLKMKEMLSEENSGLSAKNHTIVSKNNDGSFVIMGTFDLV